MFIVRIAGESQPEIKCFQKLDAATDYAKAASTHGHSAAIYEVAEPKDVRRALHEFEMEECALVRSIDPKPSASEIDASIRARAKSETARVLREIGFS